MPQRLKSDQQLKSLEQERAPMRQPLPVSEGMFMRETTVERQNWADTDLATTVDDIFMHHSPLIEVVPNTHEDIAIRAKAARFIGACAMSDYQPDYIEAQSVKPIESLYDGIKQAAAGNLQARNLITTNVATDVIERSIKSGHVMKVHLDVDAAGRIQQFGQSMESVQANSLRCATANWQMRERIEAEATNTFRMDE